MKKFDPLFEVPAIIKAKKLNKVKKIDNVKKKLERVDSYFAKTELEKVYKKIKKKHKDKIIGEYITDSEKDLFIREMTFGQLASINIDAFLGKRSINDQKIKNILEAFKKLFSEK